MKGLDKRTVVVTGGSGGIGSGIIAELASHGLKVFNIDVSAPEIADSDGSDANNAEFICADITDRAEVVNAYGRIAEHGPVDFLVNNAGRVIERVALMETSEELWARTIALNVTGAFYMTQVFAAEMIERQFGAIVNITATSVRFSWLGATPYEVAKAGLGALTRGAALELGRHNVRVNAVAPATIETPRVRALVEIEPEHLTEEAYATALGRVGQPVDVARVVAFLLSDEAGYLTGAEILCDGGYSVTGQTFDPKRFESASAPLW